VVPGTARVLSASPGGAEALQSRIARHRDAGPEDAPAFLARGFAARHFFPHRLYLTPRSGPDGLHYASVMCGMEDPAALRQLLLFAHPEAMEGIDPSVFTDDDIVWHQQHLGLTGLVAHANLVVAGDTVFVTLAQSDLVQRIGRRRDLKTRVESRFKGWAHLLVNGALACAIDRGARRVLWPTSRLALRHCDQRRDVRPELFERIYDRTVGIRADPEPIDEWWSVDVEAVRDRVAPLARRTTPLPRETTICVTHDIERGLGHVEDEPGFVAEADRVSPGALASMLEIEASAGVRATYNVVGRILPEVRGPIEAGGHAVAFHSFRHSVRKGPGFLARLASGPRPRAGLPGVTRGADYRELIECRELDYRLKGYRPPQSRLSPGLSDANLVRHNFEWLATSAHSLGREEPWVENGLVKIPVHLDDFDLHRGTATYDEWESRVRALVERLPLVVIGLHDCYGPTWLPRYAELLALLQTAGRLRTCDEVAARLTLAGTGWS